MLKRPITAKSAPIQSAALFAVLVVILIVRAAGAVAPSPYLWAFDFQAHLGFWAAWLPWLLAALALIPPVASRIERPFAGLSPGAGFAIALAAALVAIVVLLPDTLRFVGDANLRFGNLTVDEDPAKLFPQATPLDVALHYRIPRALADRLGIAREQIPLAIGALWAAALAALAVVTARVLGARGPAAFASAAAIAFGGTLALSSGYLKAFVELSLLTGFAAVAAIRLAREGRGLLMLGSAVAAALFLHRSALALLPVTAAAWLVALGPRRGEVPWRRPATWAGIAAPLVALAVTLPGALATLRSFDLPRHFATAHAQRSGGAIASAFEPHHLIDVANLLVLLMPLAPLVLVQVATFRRRPWPEGLVLAALLVPWLAVVLLVRPQQGNYRDWDVFAPAGMALALVAAWQLAATLPRVRPGLALAVALAAFAPAVQWVALQHDVPRALARIETRVDRTPWVDADERAATYDFVGMRYLGMHAVEAAPHPRLIVEWGMVSLTKGDFVRARSIFQRAAALDANRPAAWRGLMTAASALGDRAELARATAQLERLTPDDPMVRDARALLDAPAPPPPPSR